MICIAGARPNFMKVKPVLDALHSRGVDCTFIHTGQHYDDAMSVVFFDELGLREPDFDLGVGPGSHAEQTARVMVALEPIVERRKPDVVVVVGDVNSTLAGALVAAKGRVRLAHVEAGLRSRDWSMPEEINRIVTDRLSGLLFVTSGDAIENLRAEGITSGIHFVGNTMIDSLLANLRQARERRPWERFGLQPGAYGVVTLHRPPNVDDSQKLSRLLGELSSLADDIPLVFPVHPRTQASLKQKPPGIRFIEPLGYLDFIGLEAESRIVLTDSGGIQEETTVLGVRCVTIRENTERPVTVSEGTNRIAGLDPETVVRVAREALEEDVSPRLPELWDGHAGERIADVLVSST